eukprot:scaffold2249_cov201-Alexandrium_tamarense.AAC.9
MILNLPLPAQASRPLPQPYPWLRSFVIRLCTAASTTKWLSSAAKNQHINKPDVRVSANLRQEQ